MIWCGEIKRGHSLGEKGEPNLLFGEEPGLESNLLLTIQF